MAIVFTLTLWMRLVGGGFWLARRSGRPQDPADDLDPRLLCLQLHCRVLADFAVLLIFRALLGIFMGAERLAGAALAMESWPIRSRGFMSGVLQGSWGIGFALSSLIWGLFVGYIGWRGILWIGALRSRPNGQLAGVKLTRPDKGGISAADPKPTSDALRHSKHETTKSARDFISRLVDLFMAGRMPLDGLITRDDFADFNFAAADRHLGRYDKTASAVAAVTTAPAISPTRPGQRLPPVSRI